MKVIPIERTVVEYSLVMDADDAKLCLEDPHNFGEKIRKQLLPHKPGDELKLRIGKVSRRFTIGGNGRKTTKRSNKKAPSKAGAKKTGPKLRRGEFECSCGRIFTSAAGLKRHQTASGHKPALAPSTPATPTWEPASAKSSISPATAATAA